MTHETQGLKAKDHAEQLRGMARWLRYDAEDADVAALEAGAEALSRPPVRVSREEVERVFEAIRYHLFESDEAEVRAKIDAALLSPSDAHGGEGATWPEKAADLAWLERQKDNGHCGESTPEAIQRERFNARVDRLLTALVHPEPDVSAAPLTGLREGEAP